MIRQGNSGQYMVPGASANTYNYTVFGPAPFTGAFPFSIAIIQGNPNLKSETARTTTLGTVSSSPFEAALISHLQLSVDWYRIMLKDAIGVADYNAVYQQCLDAQFNTADRRCAGLAHRRGAVRGFTGLQVHQPRDQRRGSLGSGAQLPGAVHQRGRHQVRRHRCGAGLVRTSLGHGSARPGQLLDEHPGPAT